MNLAKAYALLEIPQNSRDDEVKKSYRRLIKKFHPDVCEDKVLANEKTRLLNEAYELIGKSKYFDDGQAYNDWTSIIKTTAVTTDLYAKQKTTEEHNGYFLRDLGGVAYRNIWDSEIEDFTKFLWSFYSDVENKVKQHTNSFNRYFERFLIHNLMYYAATEYIKTSDIIATLNNIDEYTYSINCSMTISDAFTIDDTAIFTFQKSSKEDINPYLTDVFLGDLIIGHISNYPSIVIDRLCTIADKIYGRIINVDPMTNLSVDVYTISIFFEFSDVKSNEHACWNLRNNFSDNSQIIENILAKYIKFSKLGQELIEKEKVDGLGEKIQEINKEGFYAVGYAISFEIRVAEFTKKIVNNLIDAEVKDKNWLEDFSKIEKIVYVMNVINNIETISYIMKSKVRYFKLMERDDCYIRLRKNKGIYEIKAVIV